MARKDYSTCSVVGCVHQHKSLHRLPSNEETRTRWIHFIFDGNVPAVITKKRLLVCANHFTKADFSNLGLYNMGAMSRLVLEPGAIPSIRVSTSSSQQDDHTLMMRVEDRDKDKVFVQYQGQRLTDTGCQTDNPKKTVGTQLSKYTLVERRSKGSQACVLTVSVAVGTSVQWRRPPPVESSTFWKPFNHSKRRQLEPEDDHGVSADPSIPGGSVSTESALVHASPSINDVPKYTVDEDCLLQLFEDCPVCDSRCEVHKTTRGTCLALRQLCIQCSFSRNWKSQQLEAVSSADPPESSAADWDPLEQHTDSMAGWDEEKKEKAVPSGDPRSCTSDTESSAAAITEMIGFSDDNDSSDEGSSELDQREHNSDSDWDPLEHCDTDSKLADSESDAENVCRTLCPECGTFFNSQNQKAHLCEDKKPYSCLACGKRFLEKVGLSVHSKIHKDGLKHECKYCFSTFRTRTHKLLHEQSHPPAEKPYRCPDCPQMFAKMLERNDHLLTHRGPTTHICLSCNMEFSCNSALERHVVVHTKAKQFVCEVCQRSFTQPGNLKSHMRVHTGEKPYQCQDCEKSFNHNVSLKSHIQRYHGQVPDPGVKVQTEKASTDVSEVEKDETNQTDSNGVDAEQDELESSCIESDEAEQSNTLYDPEHGCGGEKKKKVWKRKKCAGRPRGRPKKNAVITSDEPNQLKRRCVRNENDQGNSESTDEEHEHGSDPTFEPSERKRSKKIKGNRPT